MVMSEKIFLSARWEYLAMFNYQVDPLILEKHLPPGTEIDYFDGKALVSIVGFLFKDTKVLGIRWPGYVNFEEANLRYYVKRFDGHEWKRGVGFVSEIVPQKLIATLANLFYNEHYSIAKMGHRVSETTDNIFVEYRWQKKKYLQNIIQVNATNTLLDIEKGSEAEFIFEHYYGFNKLNETTTIEYSVEHPRWKIYPVTSYSITCNTENLYGKEFVPFIDNYKPHSVFLARGSSVSVRTPIKIKAN
jgi:uncharacterized protein